MKTKGSFYICTKLHGKIGAKVKDGYVECIGERVYGYDKRILYWCITDINTGLFINCFPKIKDCQDYLKEHFFEIEQIAKNRECGSEYVKFNRAVAALKCNKGD